MTPLLSDGVVDRAPDPLRCPTCRGEGTVAVRPDCIHAASNGRCPCGPDEAPCPEDCHDGTVGCTNCGEKATRIHDAEPSCDLCAGIRDEDLRDGPDYDGLMASARALDRSGW